MKGTESNFFHLLVLFLTAEFNKSNKLIYCRGIYCNKTYAPFCHMCQCANGSILKGGDWGGEMLKFVEDLQISCEGEKDGYCVLFDRHYHESYVWP